METYFFQGMVTHETAFIYISVDTMEVSFSGILPYEIIFAVFENGLGGTILSYHEGVAVHLASEVLVVEISATVDEWLLAVVVFYEVEKFE
jgi:hypothetical protein